jgi:hypothetical protein
VGVRGLVAGHDVHAKDAGDDCEYSGEQRGTAEKRCRAAASSFTHAVTSLLFTDTSGQRMQVVQRTLVVQRIRAGFSFTRRSSCAFNATTIVEADIRTAPAAGESTMPAEERTPAASGMDAML